MSDDSDGTAELGGGWRLWRQMVLRGAGFPAAQVLALGAPESAEAARRWFSLQAVEEEERSRAIAALQKATETAAPGEGKPLGKLIKRLRAGELPEAPPAWRRCCRRPPPGGPRPTRRAPSSSASLPPRASG
jgi:hypothetical protein